MKFITYVPANYIQPRWITMQNRQLLISQNTIDLKLITVIL